MPGLTDLRVSSIRRTSTVIPASGGEYVGGSSLLDELTFLNVRASQRRSNVFPCGEFGELGELM